jgi:hypothetical protein
MPTLSQQASNLRKNVDALQVRKCTVAKCIACWVLGASGASHLLHERLDSSRLGANF